MGTRPFTPFSGTSHPLHSEVVRKVSHTYTYDSPQAQLTHLSSRISPVADQLLTRLLRWGAPCLGCNRRHRESARSVPHTLARGLNVGISDGISAKSCPVSDLTR